MTRSRADGDPSVGVLLVGAGRIAVPHAEALAGSDAGHLVAVTDPLQDAAVDLADRFGARPATNLEEGLADPDVDAVIVCAPTAAPPSIRRSTSMGNLTPSFSPICCASSIMRRATSRVPGSVQSTSSVAWVRAEIGLNDRLPHSFSHISSRMRGRTGARRPASDRIPDNLSARSDLDPSGSPSEKRLPSICRITPGS